MSLKSYCLVALAFSSLVFAAPAPAELGGVSQCNTGELYCCNSVQTGPGNILGGLVGIGVGCIPVTVIGVLPSISCTAQPACCENVQTNGLVNLVCSPLSL